MMKTSEKRRLYNAFSNYQDELPRGLYVHIPFCNQKCYYCDFLSYQNQEKRIDGYIESLLREIELYKEERLSINTIYLGGGTPSYIPHEQITRILNKIKQTFDVLEGAEVTIEINPDHISEAAINAYLKAGINRASIGIQTFDEELLRLIGRSHTAGQAVDAVKAIRRYGFKNISIDLINAIPNQSVEQAASDIARAIDLKPDHISLYSLIVEPNTHMSKIINSRELKVVDDEIDRDMFAKAKSLLLKSDYEHYEISNFAKAGYESVHNLKYWELGEYIGLGLGSASHFRGKRTTNTGSFKVYDELIQRGEKPLESTEDMDYDTLKVDFILMGLRLSKGIDRNRYVEIFGVDFYKEFSGLIDSFVSKGHMVVDEASVYFTQSGMDISNSFFVEII